MTDIDDDFPLGRRGGERRNLLLESKMEAAWVAWNPLSSERGRVRRVSEKRFLSREILESLPAR